MRYFPKEDTKKFIYKLIKIHRIGSTLEVAYKKMDRQTRKITKHHKKIPKQAQYFEFFVKKDKTDSKRIYLPQLNILEKIECKYSDLYSTMLDLLSIPSNDKKRVILKSGTYPQKKKIVNSLHFNPIFFGTDIDIVQHYYNMFNRELITEDSSLITVTTAHCDTEVYAPLCEVFPDQNKAPVPILTTQVYIPSKKKAYIHINLETYRLSEKWKDLEQDIISEDSETFAYYYIETNRIWLLNHNVIKDGDKLTFAKGTMYCNGDVIPKDKLRVLDIEFVLLKDELHTICQFFKDIRDNDTDVVYFWNMNFDIITIQNRLIKIFTKMGKNEKQIQQLIGMVFAGKSGFSKFELGLLNLQYRYDSKKFDFKLKTDKVYFQGDYWIMDMAMIFAKITSFDGMQSYKLDDILKKYVSESKVSYDANISDFMENNPRKFLLYSVMDVVGMESINKKLEVTKSMVARCEMAATPIIMERHPTVVLTNYNKILLEKVNYTVGNNLNKIYPPEDDLDANGKRIKKFKGALVAKVWNNYDDGINGTYRIYPEAFDFDLKSLYPKTIEGINFGLDNFRGTIKLVDGRESYHLLNKKICGIEAFFYDILGMPSVKSYIDKLDTIKIGYAKTINFDDLLVGKTYNEYTDEVAKSLMYFTNGKHTFEDVKYFVYENSEDEWNKTLLKRIVTIDKSDDKNNINVEDYSTEELIDVIFTQPKDIRPILAGSGGLFDKMELSPLVSVVTVLLNERDKIKKEMLECIGKDQERFELLNMQQTNVKVLTNSLYGAIGQKMFPLFNLNAVQAIPLTGHFPTLIGIWGFEATMANNFDISSMDALVSMITLTLKKMTKGKIEIFHKLYGVNSNFFNLNTLMDSMERRCDAEFFKLERTNIEYLLSQIDPLYYPFLTILGQYCEFLGISVQRSEYNKIFAKNRHYYTNLCKYTYEHKKVDSSTREYKDMLTLITTFVMPNYIYDNIHEFYHNTQKKVARYSDTDSALLTVSNDYLEGIRTIVFKDINEEMDYNDFKDLVVDLNIDLMQGISFKLMHMLTDKMDVRPEQKNAFFFKSEFKFSILYLFKSKNYIAHITKKEGKKMDFIDYKGLPIVKSNINIELSNIVVKLIDEVLIYDYYKYNTIDVAKFMHKFTGIIDMVVDSIKSGSSYYIPTSMKYSYGHYKTYERIHRKPLLPARERGVFAVMLWDIVNPNNSIQQGNRFLYLPIKIKFKTRDEMIELFTTKYGIKLTDDNIDDLMRISRPKKEGKNSFNLFSHLAVPYGATIPQIFIDHLGLEKLIENMTSPMTSILEVLGMDYDIMKGFTNITKI